MGSEDGDDAVFAAVRDLKLAEPSLGVKALVAKLRETIGPQAAFGAKEVRVHLQRLEQEAPASVPASAPVPAADAPEAAPAAAASATPRLACTVCATELGASAAVVSCSLCTKMGWTATEHSPLRDPKYCSEKCRRRHTAAHREWHREVALRIEHKLEEMFEGHRETTEKLLGNVSSTYDLENVHGVQLMDAGDRKGAIRKFKELIKMQPYEPEAYFNLGGTHATLGDSAKALKAFASAFEWHLETDLGWSQSAVMVHQCILSLRKRVSAKDMPPVPAWHADASQLLLIADLCTAIQEDDDGPWAMRADALQRLGRKSEAAQASRKAKELKERASCKWNWSGM